MAGTTERPIGFGRLLRKEDPRFIRGKATTSTTSRCRHVARGDPAQPARARAAVSIDTSRALEHPKVRAVITGADLARRVWRGCRR